MLYLEIKEYKGRKSDHLEMTGLYKIWERKSIK